MLKPDQANAFITQSSETPVSSLLKLLCCYITQIDSITLLKCVFAVVGCALICPFCCVVSVRNAAVKKEAVRLRKNAGASETQRFGFLLQADRRSVHRL